MSAICVRRLLLLSSATLARRWNAQEGEFYKTKSAPDGNEELRHGAPQLDEEGRTQLTAGARLPSAAVSDRRCPSMLSLGQFGYFLLLILATVLEGKTKASLEGGL